ncbi:MAG: DHH family phosphoesterase [Candidatus Roizmanbacteria bacterium]
MNPNDQLLPKIGDIITKGNSGIIILPVNPTVDAIAGATSLYLALNKINKGVTLVCAQNPQSDMVGADKIQNSFASGGDNLVISFPYAEGSIDKVDYSISGNFFNLIISPRQGQPKLDPSKVSYSYTGGNADFIITIDAPNLNSLGQIYTENQNEFAGKNIINIDRHLINDNFGTVNLVNKTSSSTSEIVLNVIQHLRIEIDKDMASNIYAGVSVATNNFTSYSVNATTFESAATLLKAGAIKRPTSRPGGAGFPQPLAPSYPPLNQGIGSGMMQPQMPPRRPPMQQPMQQTQPMMQQQQYQPIQQPPISYPQPLTQPQQNSFDQQRAIEDIEIHQGPPEAPQQTPQDWLKPKIFKGSGLI